MNFTRHTIAVNIAFCSAFALVGLLSNPSICLAQGDTERLDFVTSPRTEDSVPTFTKIDTGVIAVDGGYTQGSSWADYDNDGNIDLLKPNGSFFGPNSKNSLFHNEGNGTFTKVNTGPVVEDNLGIGGPYSGWGDYDNDGDPDLYIALASGGDNRLYRNDGAGQFTRFTSGIIPTITVGPAVSWVDYDNDSWLDLFIGTQISSTEILFHNNGDSTFTKVDTGLIVVEKTNTQCVNWADFDNDGDMDVFLAGLNFSSSAEPNRFYVNEGGGKFTKSTAIPAGSANTPSSAWGDFNNDGYLDLYIINSYKNNTLYLNNGNGSFESRQIDSPESASAFSLGSACGDFDNDGDLDIIVMNERKGISGPAFPNPTFTDNFFFINNGDATFTQIITDDIITDSGHSCTTADYDNDGDLDILIVNGSLGAPFQDFLYYNDGNDNNWINITCIGTTSNRTAIGTRICAKATINGKVVSQIREIAQMSGMHSNSSMRVHFGLGDATVIDTLKFRWPSGHVDVLINVETNHFITVEEGEDTVSVNSITEQLPEIFKLNQNYPNPFNPVTKIDYSLAKSDFIRLTIYNILGQEIQTLVNKFHLAGNYTVNFNAKNLPSGIYFYKLKIGEKIIGTKKMILMR
jgi:hypothetical protein